MSVMLYPLFSVLSCYIFGCGCYFVGECYGDIQGGWGCSAESLN